MEVWEHDDYETPIENYPGYLGLCLEGTFMPDVAWPQILPLTMWEFGSLPPLETKAIRSECSLCTLA